MSAHSIPAVARCQLSPPSLPLADIPKGCLVGGIWRTSRGRREPLTHPDPGSHTS